MTFKSYLNFVSSPMRLFLTTSSLMLIAVLLTTFTLILQNKSPLRVWLTSDQRAMLAFVKKDYVLAARLFDDAEWKAISFYQATNFSAAEQLWSRQEGAIALFNRGNALILMQQYQQAADSYELALQINPDHTAAQHNLVIANTLIEVVTEKDDFSKDGNTLKADDVDFESNRNKGGESNSTEQTQAEALSSIEVEALWMRRLKTSPVDFLKRKFQYQVNEVNP